MAVGSKHLFVIGGRVITPVLCTLLTAPAAAAEGSGGLPQFDATWFPSQLFWLAVMFGVLHVFFARTALPRIEQTLRNRQFKIQDDTAQAEVLAQRAAAIREAYERDMVLAREKVAAALKTMDERVKQKLSDRLYSYRTKFTAEIARAEGDLARERARLSQEMDAVAAEIAAHAASAILQTPADLAHAQQVIDRLHHADKAA